MVQNTFWGTSGLNIFICDLFMFLSKDGIANYADDNTPYSTGTGIHNIHNKPQTFCQNGLWIII